MPRISETVFRQTYSKNKKVDKTICFQNGKAVSVVRSNKIKNEASLSHKLYDLHFHLTNAKSPTAQKTLKGIAIRIYSKRTHKQLGLIRRFVFSVNNLFKGRGFHSEIYFYNQIQNFAVMKSPAKPKKEKEPEKSQESHKKSTESAKLSKPAAKKRRRQPKREPLRDFSELKNRFAEIKEYFDVIASFNAKIVGMDQGELNNWKYSKQSPVNFNKVPENCKNLKGIIQALSANEIDEWAKKGILPRGINNEVQEKDYEFQQLLTIIADDLNAAEIRAWADEKVFPFNFNQIPYSKQMPIVVVAAPQGGGGRAQTYTPKTDYRIPEMMTLIFQKLSDEQLKAMMTGYFAKDRSGETTSNWAFINMLIGINGKDKQLELTKMLLDCTKWNAELLQVGNYCLGKKGDVDFEAIKSFIQNYVKIALEYDNADQRLDRLWGSSSALMLNFVDQKFFDKLDDNQKFSAWVKQKQTTDKSVGMFRI